MKIVIMVKKSYQMCCTTNGLAPVAKVLALDKAGIVSGLMTTPTHAYTASQPLLDTKAKILEKVEQQL